MTIQEMAENMYKAHSERKMKHWFGAGSWNKVPDAAPPIYIDLPEEVRSVWVEYAKLELMPDDFVRDFSQKKAE